MSHRIAWFALASLAFAGCHIEHIGDGNAEEDTEEDAPCDPTEPGDGHDAATPGECATDHDCDPSFVCDLASGGCVPGSVPRSAPSCADLESEAACSELSGCTPIYAGIDCSCGPDCACVGGQPGCICESFQFFACTESPAR